MENEEKENSSLDQLTEDRIPENTFAGRLAGLFFSFMVGILLAVIVVVFISNQYSDISATFLLDTFIASVVIFTLLIFLLRKYVKGFARVFSVTLFAIFLLAFLSNRVIMYESNRLCERIEGTVEIIHSTVRGAATYKCLVSVDIYNYAIKNSSFLYRFTTFEINH